MKARIKSDTTNIGNGKIFDIIFYSFFSVFFYISTIIYLLQGQIGFSLLWLCVAVLDTVIAISNIKKRKSKK